MSLSTFLAFLVGILLSGVHGGEIPIINGILGGVYEGTPFRKISERLAAANVAGQLRVTENSGICETTAGVYQASGYGDLTATQSIWFWFFEARINSATAPLVLWFNGGPGSSSMIGLFQENGPCRITNDSSSVTPNKYSWNNAANMLYIDQPVGVGWSHGDTTVGTSEQAASDMWKFMQIFLTDGRFSKYANNGLGIFTESYGGHYGPVFANYFLDQNSKIKNGSIVGLPLNLQFLGIGDGLVDPITQYPEYMTYAASNPYHPLVNASVISTAANSYNKTGGCKDLITSCNNNGNNSVCFQAQNYCNTNILDPLAGNYDVYYVLAVNPDAYPPDIKNYLGGVQSHVGAETTWQETNALVYFNFAVTGDWMRTKKAALENVINAGVRTLIFTGDADYILNFNGVEAMVDGLYTKFSVEYKQQAWSIFNVNGTKAGQYKNAGTLSYLRIYGAGHEVPAYKYGSLEYGQAAYQFFYQIVSNSSLSGS